MSERSPSEQAAAWLVRLESGALDNAGQIALARWLETEENAQAFARARRTWSAIDLVVDDPAILAERNRIVEKSHAAWQRRPLAIAASLAAALCLGLLLTSWRPWLGQGRQISSGSASAQERIATRIGERSAITLSDGSVLTLNTDSVARIAYSKDERLILLERGQAFFTVAKHRPQPFVVEAGGQRIVATGTAFDVRIDAGRTQVVLIEGEVRVAADQDRRATGIVLRPAQKLVALPGRDPSVSAAAVEELTSWTSGRVIFRDMPLRNALPEINRYSDLKIVLADPSAGALTVSGVFLTGQPTRFARAVAEIHPLLIREDKTHGALVLERKR